MKSDGTSPEVSLPRELFALQADGVGIPYEVAPDGKRFLVCGLAASRQPLQVIVNWQALLKKGTGAP
jgi:hypothetical protein